MLAGVALLAGLGWMTAKDATDTRPRRRGAAGDGVEAERYPAPVALPEAPPGEALERALLSPPRDTRALDPLAFEPPPMPPEPVLLPPLSVAPAPEHWARTLVRPQGGAGELTLFDASPEPAAVAAVQDEAADGGGFRGASSWRDLEAGERMEAASAFRSVYDWLRADEAETLFGRVTNPDRYGLRLQARLEEPILFVQVDPFTGAERFAGQPPIEYTRNRVLEWALADTLANRLELRYAELPTVPTPGTYPEFLALADDALAARLDVIGALDMSRDLLQSARDYAPDEPAPAVGLARVLRASFEIEPALQAFSAAAAKFPSRAGPWLGRAELLAELLLDEAAEESFARALQLDGGGWRARSAYGAYLLDRGRSAEALPVLELAADDLPSTAEAKEARVAVRLDLARAQLGVGRPEAAHATFGQALSAEADNQRAMAGRLACALSAPQLNLAVEDGGAGNFAVLDPELLVARAFLELDASASGSGDPQSARADLERAIDLLHFTKEVPLSGLSYLAARNSQPELALGFVERALEASPGNVWGLYQRGRLLRGAGDLDGSAASLRAALERASDFEHALFELGLVELERDRAEYAIRLFERCFELSRRGDDGTSDALAGRSDALALIGVAELRMNYYQRAAAAFEAALAINPDRLDARAGSAWCRYLTGDVEEATIQLRNLDDLLRNEPPDNEYRVWALAQIERIEEHASKDIWADAFEYKTVGNGWSRDEGTGPQTELEGGIAVLSGTFSSTGEARFLRRYRADEFIAIEADLRVSRESTCRAGLFVARERQNSSGDRLTAFAGLARSRDAVAQVRVFGGGDDPGWIDLSTDDLPFPDDEWVRIRIERRGEGSRSGIDIYMDGVPVVQGVPATGLARGAQELFIGLFVEGDNGRVAHVEMDNVEVTRRKL